MVLHEQKKLAGVGNVAAPKGSNRVENIEIKLEPCGSITGRAVDTDKKPIAGAMVHAYVLNPIQANNASGQAYSTSVNPFLDRAVQTDSDGSFTLDLLIPAMPGRALISKDGFVRVNIPPFKLQAGERKDVGDLTLTRADQSVAGIVVDPAGRPLHGAMVSAFSRRDGAVSNSQPITTDRDGRFRIGNLAPGAVNITASFVVDRRNSGRFATGRVSTDAGSQNVRIVLFVPPDKRSVEAVVGNPAPEFPVASWHNCKYDGPEHRFTRASFARAVVLLAFVDEAKPSQRVLPQFQTLQEKLGNQGVFVLRVYEGGEADELAKLSPLPMVVVPGGIVPGYAEAMQKYGIRATPTLFLIDKQGVLRYADVKVEELEGKVKGLLKD